MKNSIYICLDLLIIWYKVLTQIREICTINAETPKGLNDVFELLNKNLI